MATPTKLSYLTATDLGMDKESIKRSLATHVEYTQAKDEHTVTTLDLFKSVALAARDRMADRWNKTQQSFYAKDRKRVYYLSLEFLTGRLLKDGLLNLGIEAGTRAALEELGLDLEDVAEVEWDPGLGNGGLGRLAACFLDSMATLGIPAVGYGIRYEYGIFQQAFHDGEQVERADNWLRHGNPWEIERPERLFPVKFYGRVAARQDQRGWVRYDWVDTQDVLAMAYDLPVPGYKNGVVNTLRLWSAKATREFDFSYFNQGDYIEAIQDKASTENISRVLYPSDATVQGRELRLKQEYFFVSATLQDALRRHQKTHASFADLPEKAVFQLNDTHPAVAVAELMRLLLDEHGLGWDEAWRITTGSLAYTNHTVMPEALEQWPVSIFARLLPRHLQILHEINRRFLEVVRARFPGDEARVRRMSIFGGEGAGEQVRMANLAIVGSQKVNGVSALHTEIIKERIFPDFVALWPEKFVNETNGVTQRRWLASCNPGLAALITEAIGDGWITDLDQLQKLAPLAEDAAFRQKWRAVKRANKVALAGLIEKRWGLRLDPDSLFDVQVKRIHEYKRQILNVLAVIALYQRYKKEPPGAGAVPRTVLIGGKAAPGYRMAKRHIRLVNGVANVVNNDPEVSRYLRVFFLPNYSVSLAEKVIPAADLSEQISTAGTEASGTGNMKFALNGALTIGTLDGANIEIRAAVGEENFFMFGLTDAEAVALRKRGYDPRAYDQADPDLHAALAAVARGDFSPGDPGRFLPVVEALLGADAYLVLADFAAYRACQERVSQAFTDAEGWARMSILNTARMGRFSSDATIAGYARDIWNVPVR